MTNDRFGMGRCTIVMLAAVAAVTGGSAASDGGAGASLRSALTFHAPFDGTVDAVHGAGDRRLHWAPSFKERAHAVPGLPPGGQVQHAAGAGRYGDALRFTAKGAPVVLFQAARNVTYAPRDWSGTVSFWLSTDPERDLPDGFCDPVQITPRAWNDAAFFVEFEKRAAGIPFRLGAYADFAVWNPAKRRFDDIPAVERPLITVEQPPFAGGRWTHVLFTFERFNTGRPDGAVRLYLDGTPRGELRNRQQTFTWAPEETVIALGLGYVGLLDDLAVFDRVLTDEEIRTLQRLDGGVKTLR